MLVCCGCVPACNNQDARPASNLPNNSVCVMQKCTLHEEVLARVRDAALAAEQHTHIVTDPQPGPGITAAPA
jgi:hypothetical protein